MPKVRVLFVCSGNTCRSPMAEGVLRHRLAERGLAARFEADSAGLEAVRLGRPPDPRAVDRAAARGTDIGGRRARRFSDPDFDRFDLILAMDRGHLDELRGRRPTGARAEVHLFLAYAGRETGRTEVPDPFPGALADYDLALDLIEPGMDGVIAALKRDFP